MTIRMKLLIVCAGLLSLTCPSRADSVCSVPNTQKSYVTALALNMARSVGPCVTPDPSVLLALNIGNVPDSFARETLIKLLREDSVHKVTENQPFTSGKVALYVLALRSSCSDPTKIYSSGENINLVHLLETKTNEELHCIANTQSPRTTWYQVALDVLALCVMSNPSAITAAKALAEATSISPPGLTGSVDTAAVAVMGLTCVLQMDNVPSKTVKLVKSSLSILLDLILNAQNNGLIGNIYSTGLAGQALTAAQPYYSVSSWNCSRTISTVIDLIPEGKFSIPISAAQVLPLLWGKSYLSVKGMPCPADNASLITVDYTIYNDLTGNPFKYSITVLVNNGSTLLQVMEKAAEINPKDFSFDTENSSWGPFVTTINKLGGSDNDKTYWQFFSNETPLQEGVGTYKVHNKEHILAIFSKY
ncbi:cobalamin binding intrinsic factor-like [Pseudophryne corroboree]|uniref:cobalamin binding intrinsic factor-like n=1 Tax=Pseudophryne corroboree TaxID=495146 RepID=UPI003081211B